MAIFPVLYIGSIVYALYISVWKWNVRSGPVGLERLDNYTKAFRDPVFITAIKNALYYTVVWVPLTMIVALFLAIIVNQKIRGRTFFRAAFYFPAIASSAAITTLWIFLLAPFGLFNDVRAALGVNPLFEALLPWMARGSGRRSAASPCLCFARDTTSSPRRPWAFILFVIIFSATLLQRRLFGQAPAW